MEVKDIEKYCYMVKKTQKVMPGHKLIMLVVSKDVKKKEKQAYMD